MTLSLGRQWFDSRLFEFFNGKQLLDVEDPMKDKRHLLLPHFHRNTAAMIMKDTELNRIVEEKQQFKTKVDVLITHYDQVKKEKGSLSKLFFKQNWTISSLSKERNFWKKTHKDC